MHLRFQQLFAQIDVNGEMVEVTPGRVLAGTLVLGVLVGSLTVITLWIRRLRRGEPIFPAANRAPLTVPFVLMIFGVGLAVLFAAAAMEQSFASMRAADVAAEAAVEANANADTDTENEVEADNESGGNDADAAISESKLIYGMLSNLAFQTTVFLFFGGTLLLVHQTHGRGSDGNALVTPVHSESILWPDTDSAYAPPAVEESAARADLHVPPNPFLDSEDSAPSGDCEPWRFLPELRFAVETCLAAYVPMVIVRIGILQLQPKAPSHPFIEMLQDEVSITLMVLIAVLALVVAPVVEELLYRVTILGGFLQHKSLATGWIVSSVLFSFAHGFPDSLALLPLAFTLGYTYAKRRSYRTVMLAHCIFNTFNMIVAGSSAW